jgi:hypothetical protein
MYANWSGFCLFSKKFMGARIVCIPRNGSLTKYKRHQIVIAELEIGAVSNDFFQADVMVGTRRPGKGQNMKINEKHARF